MTVSAEHIARDLGNDLHRFVHRRVHDPVVAEDLVQDILLRVHERLTTLRDDQRMAPWVFRIARSVVIDHLRRRRPTLAEIDVAAELPEEDLNGEVASWLPAMLEQVAEPYREALRLVELEGISQRELATRLGLSPSGAKSRVQRARRMLTSVLDACCAVERDQRGNVIGYVPKACACAEKRAPTAAR